MWRILLKLSQNGLSFNVAGTKKKSWIGLKTCSFTFLVIIFGAPDLAKLHGRKHSFPWSVVGKTMAQEGSGYHETGARFSKQAPRSRSLSITGPNATGVTDTDGEATKHRQVNHSDRGHDVEVQPGQRLSLSHRLAIDQSHTDTQKKSFQLPHFCFIWITFPGDDKDLWCHRRQPTNEQPE